jgi:hypothetical protein
MTTGRGEAGRDAVESRRKLTGRASVEHIERFGRALPLEVDPAHGSGGFAPVPGACVDDVSVQPIGRTLQAAVTWDTVAGTTYFVQIGGFPDSFAYGNLRVAVR